MKRFFGLLLFVAFVALLYALIVVPCDAAEPLHLTISEPFYGTIPAPLPPSVYDMTPDEFYDWATAQNEKASADWEEWHKTAPPRWIGYGVTDYSRLHRGRYFGSGTENGSIRYYEKRFLNPDYYSRPLTIINPYCQPKRQFSNTTGVWLHHDSFHEVNP